MSEWCVFLCKQKTAYEMRSSDWSSDVCSSDLPKQTGSGGKVTLHGISKRGDAYLRTLLIHGARSVLQHAKEPGPWVEQLGQRRPPNVVVVALANKMARTIWAVLAHDRVYQKEYVSVRPARSEENTSELQSLM